MAVVVMEVDAAISAEAFCIDGGGNELVGVGVAVVEIVEVMLDGGGWRWRRYWQCWR